uniref:Egg protein n=1 Tax=Galaxea fascicularis TaxID=46745 RepID=Q5R227_GALFS|nr:egg protein [Galaxea fascicularis]
MNPFWVILLSLGAVSSLHLGYQKEQRYTYSYQTEASQAIPGEAKKSLGLRIKCQVHIDVLKKMEMQATLDNCQVHQVQNDSKEEQETPADHQEAMRRKLAKPVRFSFKVQDGSLKEISAHPNDSEWSLNIKRGLVNLFQISYQAKQQENVAYSISRNKSPQQSVTAKVVYVINRDNSLPANNEQVVKLTKVMNYEKCSKRPEFSQSNYYGQQCQECQQSVGYAPYHRSAGEIEHTLTGSEDAGYVINRTEALEQHVITPLSQSAGHITVTTRQILQFQKKSVAGAASLELTKRIGQAFTAESHEKCGRDDTQRQKQIAQQAETSINEMCKAFKDPASRHAAEKFAVAVQQLRKCNQDTMERLTEIMLARQDQTERKVCLDALSFVGTREAFQVLQQKVQQKKIKSSDDLQRISLGLASAPRPTADHIDAAWKLCEEVRKDSSCRRQCLLSLGVLIYKGSRYQQDTKTVVACQQRVREMLEKLSNTATSQEDRLTFIKTLGNAGSPDAQEQLQKILKDRQQPLHTRVECVWALRRITRQAKEKTYPCLISIFADRQENPELRMATFVQLLNTEPNFVILQALTNTVRREINDPRPGRRSNQLASFVISHLSALAYHNNVLTKKRSMQARMALRLLPKMSFGLSYSKGMRLVQHSEKLQAGFEFEANKIDVPESMLPRNLNARLQVNLFGYKMNSLEFGARIENMDDVVDDIISQVRERHKRSLWGSVVSWFSKQQSDKDTKVTEPPTKRSTGRSVRNTGATSRPLCQSSFQPTVSRRKSTRPPPTFQASDEQTKQRHMSAFMKLYGNEVKFMEVKQDVVDQLARDVSDLLLGKVNQLEYPGEGITISKGGVEIKQTLEKAFMDANAQNVLPTLAGIPLNIQFRSAASVRITAGANLDVHPSLKTFWQYQSMTGNVEVKPSINTHVHAVVAIHTPFLRVGVQMQANGNSNTSLKIEVQAEAEKSCNFGYSIPQEQKDIIQFKAVTQGFSQQQDPQTCEQKEKQISLDLSKDHLTQLKKSCAGQALFGVQLCAEGQGPDLASLRLRQVPVFSAICQAEMRVSLAPASDSPLLIQWNNNIEKNDDKEKDVSGEIKVSSNKITRRLPYRITYKRDQQQLEIGSTSLVAQGYEDAKMKLIAKGDGLRLEFGRKGKPQYSVTVSGQIENQGKSLKVQANWTEVPEQWKTFFRMWEPQILYALQQFAWVRRTDQQTKQVALEFQLTSPMTASSTVKTPNAEAKRTKLSLPICVERLPTSIQEIKDHLYAKCEVQEQSIKVFDQLRYQHNIKGGCPYVLAQEYREGKQSRFELTVKTDEQGQKTLIASFQQQSQQHKETVEIKPDLTILIDGQKQTCAQQPCRSKQGDFTVRTVQTTDGKTEIQLSTKLGLHVTMEGQRIHVYVAPFLCGRVRGLCGDADGEQWNEYKDPQGRVQTLQKFIQSWQQKC